MDGKDSCTRIEGTTSIFYVGPYFQLYKLVQKMLSKILEFSLLDPFLKCVVYRNKGLAIYTWHFILIFLKYDYIKQQMFSGHKYMPDSISVKKPWEVNLEQE